MHKSTKPRPRFVATLAVATACTLSAGFAALPRSVEAAMLIEVIQRDSELSAVGGGRVWRSGSFGRRGSYRYFTNEVSDRTTDLTAAFSNSLSASHAQYNGVGNASANHTLSISEDSASFQVSGDARGTGAVNRARSVFNIAFDLTDYAKLTYTAELLGGLYSYRPARANAGLTITDLTRSRSIYQSASNTSDHSPSGTVFLKPGSYRFVTFASTQDGSYNPYGYAGNHPSDGLYDVTLDFTLVPEPSSLAMLGIAGLGLVGRRRRR